MEWIDANKHVPPPYEKVLVIQKNGEYGFAFRAPKKEKLKLEMYNIFEGEVVMWTELENQEKKVE